MGANELAAKVRESKELQVFIKQLEDEAETAKAEIIKEMETRETDSLTVDIFTVKYTAYQSSRFEAAAFKKTHADLYGQYTKTTEARRFSIA